MEQLSRIHRAVMRIHRAVKQIHHHHHHWHHQPPPSLRGGPPIYRLKDFHDEEIKETFYQSELQKVDARDEDVENRENSEDERDRKQ